MNFKGGVILTGSLLWKDKPIVHKWQLVKLNAILTKQPIKLKIQYGQLSQATNTYSILFSNHPTTEFGREYVIGFKEEVRNARILESQAFALASASGLWGDCPSLDKPWGTVGLLLNPAIDNKNKEGADIIRNRWEKIYQGYSPIFNSTDYCIDSEVPVIDKNGFLKIDWTDEMNEYDFLIATVLVANVKKVLTPKEIADKMKEHNNFSYFEHNVKNGISTFQDQEIKQLIEQ